MSELTGLTTCPRCGEPLTKHGGQLLSKDPNTIGADGEPVKTYHESWKECHACKRF